MPIDVRWIREYQGGDPERIRESQRRRFADVGLVDAIVAADEEWRRLVNAVDQAKAAKNRQQDAITKLKKAKQEVAPEMVEELRKLDKARAEAEVLVEPQAKKVQTMLSKIGNVVDDSVVVSQDEEKDNETVATWGDATPTQPPHSHHELLYMIGGYEPERGARVAGHRAYFLTDVGVLLNQAVINYGIAFLRSRQYKVMQPPFFMNKDVMAGVAQLEQFDEELYKVSGGSSSDESTDKYLIATSEQPICAYHKGEWLKETELPKRYAGISTCFRKEAGSHGRDTWGIFRVHQFEKVEQFCITMNDIEQSRAMHEEMRNLAEEYVKSLGFPYRVVNIVSGELNNAAIKKYDLEAWFPFQQKYRELVSCSNCTDYQSRAMEIRCGAKKMGEKEKKYVHMLNSTLCAAGRTICCLLENYQTPTGVEVPEILRPYMHGLDFLPFVRNMDGTPFVPAKPETGEGAPLSKKDTASASQKGAPGSSELAAKIAAKGDEIRAMKAAKASADDVTRAVADLKALKAEYEAQTGEEYLAPGQKPSSSKKKKDQQKQKKSEKKEPATAPAKEVVQEEEKPAAKAPPKAAAPSSSDKNGNGAVALGPPSVGLGSPTQPTKDATTASEDAALLDGLEKTLAFSSYVAGYTPSAADAQLYDQLVTATGGTLKPGPNVARWMSHIASFDATVRAAWK